MREYQQKYIQNVRRAAEIAEFALNISDDFEIWYKNRVDALEEIKALKAENTRLLNDCLFASLDGLHGAGEAELSELTEFADALLDWRTNLDTGVYIAIHEAMLSMYRVRRQPNDIIRELYKTGMGMYYRNRYVSESDSRVNAPFRFENEMLFTEAASYLRYYDELENEDARGYIVRSVANVALCVNDPKRKVAASSRALKIIGDEHFRALAPNLPWARFERAALQQMSSNREMLSKGDLNSEELSEVLDACYEVFKQANESENPGPRWLWPYYEMEYSCGYVSRETTLERIEKLVSETPYDRYDIDGFYGNVQLVLIYSEMLRRSEELIGDYKRLRFLNFANNKLCKMIMSYPAGKITDDLRSTINYILNNYEETGCDISFKQMALRLTQRFGGEIYIRGRVRGRLLRLICARLLDADESFFDDIPFICELSAENKRFAVMQYAEECGILCDIGLVKMGIENIRTRSMFETEHDMYLLHPEIGRQVLCNKSSTAMFADVAQGHESRYDGAQPLTGGYIRNQSPYRQMTDAVSVASFMQEKYSGDMQEVLNQIYAGEGTRFSPLICAAFNDEALIKDIEAVLTAPHPEFYAEVYESLTATQTEASK